MSLLSYPANHLWGNNCAVCPYCEHKQSMDDWHSRDEDEDDTECESCERKFVVKTIVSIEYSSVGDCKANGTLPHELECTFQHGGTIYYTCKKCKGDIYNWQLPGGTYPRLKEEEFVITKQPKPPAAQKEGK